MHLKKILLALLFAGTAPAASAMSLGDAQMSSYIGEPFSASIALLGGYDKEVRFHQVKGDECRASIIGKSANGCDSIYEGPLSFSVRRRPDGSHALKLSGPRSDDLFYRVVIAYTSAGSGLVYNTFEFLPELKAGSDVQQAVASDGEAVAATGKYGVIRGEIYQAGAEEATREPVQVRHAKPEAAPVKTEARRSERKLDAKPALKSESRLEIRKYGEYADDIHALQKENGEIEEQIVLLEKHIGLLKEVIRLKGQIGSSQVPEVAAASAPVRLPVRVAAPQAIASPARETDLLTWILLGAVLLLSASLAVMYRKIRQFGSSGNHDARAPTFSPSSINEMKPLDLTGSFVKPKW